MHPSPDRLLDAALPRWDVMEQHVGVVPAPTDGLRPDVGSVAALRPVDLDDLGRPLPDGWVRIGMDFRLSPAGTGTWLATETRVLASGPRARRAFVACWVVIRAGSGLIRRELLLAVARRAESAGG